VLPGVRPETLLASCRQLVAKKHDSRKGSQAERALHSQSSASFVTRTRPHGIKIDAEEHSYGGTRELHLIQ
jgi:hypothetical protein